MRVRRIPTDDDLDYVATTKLVDALARRSQALVCVVLRHQEPNEPNAYVWTSTRKDLPFKESALHCLIDCAKHQVDEGGDE